MSSSVLSNRLLPGLFISAGDILQEQSVKMSFSPEGFHIEMAPSFLQDGAVGSGRCRGCSTEIECVFFIVFF